MSVGKLQDRIRKLKSPLIVDMTVRPDVIPLCYQEAAGQLQEAYKLYAKALLQGLKGTVAGVRFSFGSFAVLGAPGLITLQEVTAAARELGYYILLDGVEALCSQKAEFGAGQLFARDCPWNFDGLILESYIGSDGLRPYVAQLKDSGKDLFVAVRTANRSAPEIQDLLSGTRLVHSAKADIANRFAGEFVSRSGYSQVGLLAAASSADSLRSLRSKYKNMFLLLDGADYPNANAKNCSFAFDGLGHGAAACIGKSVTGAWMEEEVQSADHVELAVAAAERMKKNIGRYITIL